MRSRGKWAAAIIAASMVLTIPALANDAAQKFAVEGSGMASCKGFLAARKDKKSPEYKRLIGFVEGYLTAANRYEPGTFDLSPWHNAAAFDLILDKHCTAHQQDSLVGSLQKMTISFRPIRIARFSKLVEVGDGTNKAVVYEAILRRAQGVLKMHGLYQGPEDGVYSPAMRDALESFQKRHKLAATGVPDAGTLWTLLNP